MFAKKRIRLRKMAAAEEAAKSGEGRGVGRFQDQVVCGIEQCFFAGGGFAPEQESQMGPFFAKPGDDLVG